MNREVVDFHHVPERQAQIHERLECWARWVTVRHNGWQTHPMWKNSKTSRQWDAVPHIPVALDTLDALAIERTVSKLPDRHRDALRWYYVKPGDVLGMCRRMGLSKDGLALMVCDARAMLVNVLR